MIAAQRQDVEVIMIGNLGDSEMATLAMQSAESGNLVLASINTHGSIKTLERLVGLFPPGQQRVARESLAGALRGLSSQVLCRRAENTGRVGAFEILFHSRAVANLIREGKITQLNQVIMSGRAAGMQLLDDNLQQLLDQRIIPGDEADRKAIEKERFSRFAPSQEA